MRSPVVIMAGGKGSRLRPLTNITPKSLLKLGGVPIIRRIMEQYNTQNFIVSVGHKAEVVKQYCDGLPYKIEYIQEKYPLGTAGALYSLINRVNMPVFVHNCDILTSGIGYDEILDIHIAGGYDMTIISTVKWDYSPYGVMTTRDKMVISLAEKPVTKYEIAAGIYIINPSVLDLVPPELFFDMPDLIHLALGKKKRIYNHHISSKSFSDIGQWPEYRDAIEKYKGSV